ncbi:hypothetical protein [Georgenia thermotolerans]|uniref:Hpt domain-containing protein n=1 Tax=Georgenia thermotolerans TaxID=527326 RepID=A0A7J5UP88_9MICO|nr:hypothetical protein [Georgenia thermotolerans]KAE8764179.1 hypothetical protein GB883_10390 [Georgenia thermotolerans]
MSVVLSQGTLSDLSEDLGAVAVCSFVRRYLDLLDGRVRDLTAALTGADVETAEVVALSLHTASAMIGAQALADVARTLAAQLRAGALATARLALGEVSALAMATAQALVAFLAAPTTTAVSARARAGSRCPGRSR